MLLDLYIELKVQVGTLQVKNQKQFWKLLVQKLKPKGLDVMAENCHNRWRVVERNYKKFIDNQNVTGRGRRYFEYCDDMNKIFGNKKNINPVLVLSNEVHTLDNMKKEENENIQLEKTPDEPQEKKTNAPQEKSLKVKNLPGRRKISVMELIREDRKIYHDQRLQIEKKIYKKQKEKMT